MKNFRKEYCEENGLNYIKPENSSMKDYVIWLENKLKEVIDVENCCKSDIEKLSKRPNTSSTWECFTNQEKQKNGNL